MVTWRVCPGEEPIAAYAAGRLPRAERDAIDAHLDTCSACSELVGMLAKLGTGGAQGSPDPVEPDRLLVGHLGRYVLLARIGVGGMGEVYAAYDPELDRRVALKLLHRVRGDELHREARAIAKLAHPNVVAVFDIGRADDVPFVAMEHVDGVTLREWLRSPRKPTQILDAFVQAGRGLAAAHAAGLVHRDVKPSNLMIDRDGRTRVLDFGLADGSAGGTPGYMAPEQARGEPVDPRADQYAFCVALWEALAGERPGDPAVAKGMLAYLPDRAVRALRRGLSPDPAARFATMDALLGELHPASRRHLPWLIGASAAILGLTAFALATSSSPDRCAVAGAELDRVWGADGRAAIRDAFAATKLPFAPAAASSTIADLDAWTAAWRAGREEACREPSSTGRREDCLEGLLAQLRPIVALASHADPGVVARADALVASLPAPVRCTETAQLAPPPPGELARLEVEAIRTRTAELEAELIAGHADRAAPLIALLPARAEVTRYGPIRARVAFLGARLANAQTRYADAIAALHTAAQLANGSRDQELLAEIWIELVKSLGNDVRAGDEAALFDRYVTALLPQLPDRARLAEQLEQARCTRNVTGAEVAAAAQHCATAIALAQRPQLANAARTRLGHFQRMLGRSTEALATLHTAVTEAERVFGPIHPDTAIAHYALGIAELSADQLEPGIAELRRALEIRRACFPAGGPAIAESLQGLGDALATAGKHIEAIALFDQGLAELVKAHAETTAEGVNLHILAGMSLEELKRYDEALVHELRAADLVEHHVAHREELGAMALRLAANVELQRGHAATGLVDAERALRMVEGAGSAAAVGKTQLVVAQLAAATGDRARARAMAATAVTTLKGAGPAGAEDLTEAQALLSPGSSSSRDEAR